MRPIVLALCIFAIPAPASAQIFNEHRAIRNYIALTHGARNLADLTPIELREVQEVDRLVREEKLDDRTDEERCRDAEKERSDGSVTRLEQRVIAMRCRDAW